MNKTIGILTSFYSFDPAYSLCSVVRDQLITLTKMGYKVVLFVLPIFNDDHLVPAGVEIRKVIPQVILEPYSGLQYPQHWKEDAKKIQDACEKNMLDIDILLCHDIFFIDQYLPYNIGLRDALPQLKCKVFGWVHSAPSPRQILVDNPHANRYNPFPGKIVYLNHDKMIDIAEMYGGGADDMVRVIHNSRDPRTFWDLDPFVVKLIDRYSLLEADIISVYPLSTPRMLPSKGLDKAIKLHSKLKELGYKTKMIVPNAHANANKEKRMLNETLIWANERGITKDELIFTSLEDKQYEAGVQPKIISDLFRLSNVFIFPTSSEVCSLVLLEAMMSGNLLVLNKEVRSLMEFAGEQALYFDFNYRQENNENYYLDLAKILASQFEINKSLQVKRRAFQKHNYDKIGRDLELLFNEQGGSNEI